MKYLKFILLGAFFGIILAKAEIISWFRIIEMFRFESFHMFGVIGSAVMLGIVAVRVLKLQPDYEQKFHFNKYKSGWKNYLFGGIIFGLGWAMTGACPGPMFINAGAGYGMFFIAILAAMAGTFTYGVLMKRLPH
ncbi:MAG: hypothetical protein RL220_855 [Bacteroidota bacterium]|jgi:uncharacterized membrane protein YedE/YeeE